MLDRLSGKLSDLIRQIGGKAHISEKNIQDAINEIKIALLEADVSLRVVRRFVNQATEEALGEKVLRSVSPGQQFVKILYDRMVALLGGENQGLSLKGPDTQSVILLAGLQGSGKTTTAAKLALHLKAEGEEAPPGGGGPRAPRGGGAARRPRRRRPASRSTARRWRDPVRVVDAALARAKREQFDVVIVDTSGRLQADEALMAELVRIRDACRPDEVLLVADAMTGQNAVEIAKEFDAKVALTGVILTKFDSDTRGGAALSVKSITGKPIKFVGVGREAGRPGALPSREDRVADPRDGRRGHPRGEGPGHHGAGRGGEAPGEARLGDLHAGGHAGPVPPDAEDGEPPVR